LKPDKSILKHEIFAWICEIARTSEIGIDASYSNSAPLGGKNRIVVSLHNLILRDFGTYITFKFESDQLGSYVFSKLSDNTYVYEIPIPLGSNYYPTIDGYLRAYEGTDIKAEQYISFATNYTLDYSYYSQNNLTGLLFEVNTSIIANNEWIPTDRGSLYMKIYVDGVYLGQETATRNDFLNYSKFKIMYKPQSMGEYLFELYLNDGISGADIQIVSVPYKIKEILKGYEQALSGAIPLMVIFIVVPGTVIIFSTRKLKKIEEELRRS
jgi:hypothetical protein